MRNPLSWVLLRRGGLGLEGLWRDFPAAAIQWLWFSLRALVFLKICFGFSFNFLFVYLHVYGYVYGLCLCFACLYFCCVFVLKFFSGIFFLLKLNCFGTVSYVCISAHWGFHCCLKFTAADLWQIRTSLRGGSRRKLHCPGHFPIK